MRLYYSTSDARISLRAPDHRIDLRAHPRGSAPSSFHVYCMTDRIAAVIGSWLAEYGPRGALRLLPPEQAAAFKFPPYLGGATLSVRSLPPLPAMLADLRPSSPSARPVLGVFNGFGSGIGDTIVGLTALRCARQCVVDQGGAARSTTGFGTSTRFCSIPA